MKRLGTVALLFCFLKADGLENFLSANYNELFSLQQAKSQNDADFESLSWISPVTLSFERRWSNQIRGGWHPVNSYSVGIDQPIFKSGGIYYGIQYAKSNFALARANIAKNRLSLKANAIELALKIRQTKFSIKKLQLQIKNRDIEIATIKELYSAGLANSIDLDNALVKKDEATIALLDLEANLALLKASFAKISDKPLKAIKIPNLKAPTIEEFLERNVDLELAKAKSRVTQNLYKMTWSKYLPTVSISARYTKLSQVQPEQKDAFTNYSLRITLPLSVNMGNDIERQKLNSLLSKVEIKNSLRAAKEDYKVALKKVAIINKRIKLAQKEVATYSRLLKKTKDLFKAGQKSKQDVTLLANSKRVAQLNVKIYKIEKELVLLGLHKKVR